MTALIMIVPVKTMEHVWICLLAIYVFAPKDIQARIVALYHNAVLILVKTMGFALTQIEAISALAMLVLLVTHVVRQ